MWTAPALLTGVKPEVLGHAVLRAIGMRAAMAVVMSIIIDYKNCKEDDRDDLQCKGQDGELEPHVGGVCWHGSEAVPVEQFEQ
ncbi:hypothetical protein JZ751_010320 [Albula glossodonta]|uniref:Uncharacterized protein n=1 Tax=Albula glossodonta TaxID=121402 RepID=A0A8T2NWA3_9TELE|nr:hypothetical protein JZ751_010320 [Albula glossodonta]